MFQHIIIDSAVQSNYYLSVARSECYIHESNILPEKSSNPWCKAHSLNTKFNAIKMIRSYSHLLMTSATTLEVFSNSQTLDNLHSFPEPNTGVIVPPLLLLLMLVLTIN